MSTFVEIIIVTVLLLPVLIIFGSAMRIMRSVVGWKIISKQQYELLLRDHQLYQQAQAVKTEG